MLKISKDLSLPRDASTSTIVVYGGKGMGKTNLGSVLVEEFTKTKDRWCVLDPMGVWWGLRHSPDGKGPGIECVILGGAHGDIPIEPTGGAVVADLVIDEGVNTIIDFSRHTNGQMWGVGEKIRFMTEYTLRLFQRQGELIDGRRREPLHQVLDEAARYIPQIIPSGSIDLARCVAAWEQVCEEGRNIGLGVTFLTQRSARMNKSVSELADVMFAFRTIGPNSLSAVMDWLGEHVEKSHVRELASQVRELDVGQALVVSPGWLKVEKIARIRMRETFDSSSTPRPGQRAKRVTGKAAKPDLAKYRERMAATIEKVKADNPKELKKRIGELERELAKKPVPANSHLLEVRTEIQKVEVPVLKDSQITRLEKIFERMTTESERHGKAMSLLWGNFNEIGESMGKALKAIREFQKPPQSHTLTFKEHIPLSVKVDPKNIETHMESLRSEIASGEITRPEQRILNAIAWMNTMGVDTPNNNVVAFLSGYTNPKSAGYTNPRGHLVQKGLITYPVSGTVALTDAGAQAAVWETKPANESELHRRILERLTNPQKRILEPLLERGKVMTNEELALSAGYSNPKSAGYTNPRGNLRSYGLIEYVPGGVKATDILFL